MDCLFCKIAAHTIPSHTITEDEYAIAFLDIHPLAPGHAVVVPKAHAERITSLTDRDAAALFLTVKKVSDIIQGALKPDGFTIGVNDGPGGGQGVPHVHVHVIPRWTGDTGSNLHAIVHNPSGEPVETIAARIKKVSQ